LRGGVTLGGAGGWRVRRSLRVIRIKEWMRRGKIDKHPADLK